jgi:hypothetical protein
MILNISTFYVVFLIGVSDSSRKEEQEKMPDAQRQPTPRDAVQLYRRPEENSQWVKLKVIFPTGYYFV